LRGSDNTVPDRKVFDAHFHIGAYGTQSVYGRDIRPIARALDHRTGDDCAAYLVRNGVQGGVVVPTYLDEQEIAFSYNTLVLDAVQRHASLVGGLWVSPLPVVEYALSKTLASLPHPRIRALKIASNTWRPYGINPSTWTKSVRRNVEQILDAARDHELVIHFHTGHAEGADPLALEAYMRRYGHAATYQLVHMGEAIAPAFAFVPRFIEWIASGYNVYTDTSLVPAFGPSWLLRELDRHNMGFDRVLFATDAPWESFAAAYAKVASMDVIDTVLDKLFWKNATALYGFTEPAS